MTVGERIRFFRKSHKVTQEKFALMLGISQTHISKIENNQDNPSDSLLHLISANFSVNYNWLITGEGEMQIKDYSKSENYTLNQCLYEIQCFENYHTPKELKNLLSQISGLIELNNQANNFKYFKYFDGAYFNGAISIFQQILSFLIDADDKYGALSRFDLSYDECEKIDNEISNNFNYYLKQLNQMLAQYLTMLIPSWEVMQDYVETAAENEKQVINNA